MTHATTAVQAILSDYLLEAEVPVQESEAGEDAAGEETEPELLNSREARQRRLYKESLRSFE